ncbi:hypothetical protein CVT25_005501 [Psilocybe cyanescens]|uniref:Uncharacterized protein n=1 Tax=Psilocybe cyanescens TaxID=93625 RepID=A0A409VZZ1_PSICY|nr:hypothetical protein CVT25_005501 [Psilocybe cyanescens]
MMEAALKPFCASEDLAICPPHYVPPKAAPPRTKPKPISGPNPDRPLFPFLVSSVLKEDKATVLDIKVFNTPSGTFFAIDYDAFVTDYIVTVGNIAIPATPKSEHIVREAVQKAICAGDRAKELIMNHHDNIPHTPGALFDPVRTVADSVRVVAREIILEGGARKSTIFTIYAMSPTKIPGKHADLSHPLPASYALPLTILRASVSCRSSLDGTPQGHCRPQSLQRQSHWPTYDRRRQCTWAGDAPGLEEEEEPLVLVVSHLVFTLPPANSQTIPLAP